jgi:thiamine-phosphate pyrophosphorylase
MPKPFDIRLYVLVDPHVAGGRDLATLAREAVAGGATLIQLRDKTGTTRDFVARARAVAAVLGGGGATFVINDRVDVAMAAGADGVHLGQDDMHPADARALLGRDAVIGLTIKNADHVAAAPLEAVDYLAVGGVFETGSKDNPDAPVGLDGLASLIGAIRGRGFSGPVCAIAGITAERAEPVIEAGADGICVVSAVIAADDPQAAAHGLRRRVDASLAKRRRQS